MNSLGRNVRFVRVSTYGKGLAQIEEEAVQAVGAGCRVLVSTSEGVGDVGDGSDSRNAAIAAWAEVLCRDRDMAWHRVGRDVLFLGRGVLLRDSPD